MSCCYRVSRHSIREQSLDIEDSPDRKGYFEHQDHFYGEYEEMMPQFTVKEEVLEVQTSCLSRAPTIPLMKEVVDQGKIVIDGRTYYKCAECGKQLHSPYTYQAHLRIHNGEKPFACPYCTKSFRIYQGLSRHVHELHEKLRPYRCDTCGNCFVNKRNLTDHQYLHTDERVYACNHCNKSFRQRSALFMHRRTHQEQRPFVCSVCSSGFYSRTKLTLHETTHSREWSHTCPACGRKFRSKHNLNRHWKMHNENTVFECPICAARFKQNRYLTNHMRKHHPEYKTTGFFSRKENPSKSSASSVVPK